jgi:HEPN domain-containing protein
MVAQYPDVADRVPYEECDISTAQAKVSTAKKIFATLLEHYGQVLGEQDER